MRIVALFLLTIALCLAGHAQENPITNGSFERIDERGVPEDWELLGDCRVTDRAHSGDNAMLLQRDSAEGLCGLNRRWEPGSGEQGAMLPVLRGGVTFWYQALEASDPNGLTFSIIPMSAEPLEVGGLRVTYTVPAGHIGDGQWHQGAVAYDYTGQSSVRWVHVSPRLRGESAALIIDDIEWVEQVGPVPSLTSLELEEVEGREGHDCTISATVRNVGDRPLTGTEARIELPAGLNAAGGAAREIEDVAPGQDRTITWEVSGARDRAAQITVSLTAGEHTATRSLDITPQLHVLGLMAAPSVVEEGRTAEVALVVRNDGHAIVRELIADLLALPPLGLAGSARRQHVDTLPPGAEATLTWDVIANGQSPAARLQAAVRASNADAERVATDLVAGPLQASPTLPAGDPGVTVDADVAAIGDGRIRLLFPRAAFGWGIARLQRRVTGAWQTVATLPRLTRLAVDAAADRSMLVYGEQIRPASVPGAEYALELLAEATDPTGVRWDIRQTVAMRRDPTRFELRVAATPSARVGLLAFDGPLVCVGDGAPPGTERLDAIFPGLEWLVRGEWSSSSLDIAPDHPHRIRYVPHPHMVTVPMMCARLDTPAGPDATVALSWDHLQPYLGDHDRPSPVFASPDRFEGRQATTMGLFAPSMPEFVEPNARVAHTPLQVAEGETVALSAALWLTDNSDETALVALQQWYRLHGAPEPNALPHGDDLVDEVEFDMAAYLRSMWNEQQRKWHPIFFGPPDWREPRWLPDFLYDLRVGSELAEDRRVASAARERYEHVVELSGLRPVADDLGFHFAGPAARLLSEAQQVAGIIAAQREDGSWRFNAYVATSGVFRGRDYGELGPDGAAEVGTCAANARRVLRFARMTGDQQAREAGLRALAFMERFRVPRAAQVWEVPVHTPDILASAHACDAYLEGYRITGDPQHLQRAVYWAWTGLPFVYVWDTEGFEFLKYASIPVFGATWYTGSWFGRPVQWNGLEYARALQRLARHDDSADWATIARGITVSAMYQQYTDEEHQALWPDSISAIDRSDSGPNFSPRRILTNCYEMLGLEPDPLTVPVTADGGEILLSAAAQIDAAAIEGDRLRCTVTCPPPLGGFLVICRASRPAQVRVNGFPAPGAVAPAEAKPPSWRYIDDAALIEIRLPGPGEHTIELDGVRFRPAALGPAIVQRLNFDFDADSEGWRSANDLAPVAASDGMLQTATTGGDPYMVRPNCAIEAAEVHRIRLRMALEPGMNPTCQLFWTTRVDPGWSEAMSVHFDAVADGRPHELIVPVGDHPRWEGTVTALRLDPGGGRPFGAVRIDYIRGE